MMAQTAAEWAALFQAERLSAGRVEWARELERVQAAARGEHGRRMSDAGWESLVERAAIQSEGVGVAPAPGLVSLPTSVRNCAAPASTPFRVKAETEAMRGEWGAFEPDPAASRLARLRMKVGAAANYVRGAFEVDHSAQCWMVTLTYRAASNAEGWSPRDITGFVKCLRRWCEVNEVPCRYVWVAELQKRGVIHYHVAVWLPLGLRCPKADAAGWWPHGMSNTVKARHATGYLMKYLSKGCGVSEGQLPKGARSHGRGGLGDEGRAFLRWLSWPRWLRERAQCGELWKRAEGGGWTAPDGSHWASEFKRLRMGAGYVLARVCEHARPFAEFGGAWMAWPRRAVAADGGGHGCASDLAVPGLVLGRSCGALVLRAEG